MICKTKKRRGRKPGSKTKKNLPEVVFNTAAIQLFRGADLKFSASLFKPMKIGSEVDTILSTEGGLMPAVNLVLCGGPGCGKTTVALDMLASLTTQGYKCLFVSAEMDEIGYYKMCVRMPKFQCVQTLFLKNYSENVKEVLEYVFDLGYDVIAIDSIAEVNEMYKDAYRTTESCAEFWFLNLQDAHKKGKNKGGYNTTFLNIQQVTKSGEFVGRNRLKHMTDAMAYLERSADGLERTIFFSKNRDCDKDFKMLFAIGGSGVHYSYVTERDL